MSGDPNEEKKPEEGRIVSQENVSTFGQFEESSQEWSTMNEEDEEQPSITVEQHTQESR